LDLNRFNLIEHANQISDSIWIEADQWSHFNMDTIGKPLVRAADSLSTDLREAFSRYSFGVPKIAFSFSELQTWLEVQGLNK
jgi:hypothetical protein